MSEQPEVKTVTQARQGQSTRARWVLLWSLILVVVVLGGMYLAFWRH